MNNREDTNDRELSARFVWANSSNNDEETELRAWLKRNNETLKNRTHQEVIWWALQNTFSEKVVYDVLSNFNVYLGEISVASGANLHVWRIEEAAKLTGEMKDGLLDLQDQWKALANHLIRGDDFEIEVAQ